MGKGSAPYEDKINFKPGVSSSLHWSVGWGNQIKK